MGANAGAMHTLTELRSMLEAHGLSPRKALGQNFLIDANLARKLIDASGVGAGDLVLEIGPGAGGLTEGLLDRGCRVVACELDIGLGALLEERFAGALRERRLTLIKGDCLDGKRAIHAGALASLGGAPFRVVANLPYNAASPLMATLATRHHPGAGDDGAARCLGQFVTIQKEVADRLLAKPGTKAFGGLTVIVQAMAEVERIATLPPECFWPRPSVTSAMIAIRPRAAPLAPDWRELEALCRVVFSARRKTLGATLGRDSLGEWPEGVGPDTRGEALAPERLAALARAWASRSGAADAAPAGETARGGPKKSIG